MPNDPRNKAAATTIAKSEDQQQNHTKQVIDFIQKILLTLP